jgi:hypothetical protein
MKVGLIGMVAIAAVLYLSLDLARVAHFARANRERPA